MALAESVVDLIEHRLQRAVATAAEVDAERVEDVAEDTGHRQQLNHAPGFQTGSGEMAVDMGTKRRATAMITIEEAEEIEPVARKEAQAAGQRIDLVQIEEQPEHAIGETMPARAHALVHHGPRIDR